MSSFEKAAAQDIQPVLDDAFCLMVPSSDFGRTKISWFTGWRDNHLIQGRGCIEDFRNFPTWSIRVMRVYGGRRFFAHRRGTNKLLLSVGLGVGSELPDVNCLVFLEWRYLVTTSSSDSETQWAKFRVVKKLWIACFTQVLHFPWQKICVHFVAVHAR
jgi:hypothetical protein